MHSQSFVSGNPSPVAGTPLCSRHPGAAIVPVVTAVLLVALGCALIHHPFWLIAVELVVGGVLIPISIYTSTYRVTLNDHIVTTRSQYAGKSVNLAESPTIRFEKRVRRKRTIEIMRIIGSNGVEIVIGQKMSGYEAFRVAILSEVPSSSVSES